MVNGTNVAKTVSEKDNLVAMISGFGAALNRVQIQALMGAIELGFTAESQVPVTARVGALEALLGEAF